MIKRKTRWTDQELVSAVRESRSIAMVIRKLGLIPAGGNYLQIKNRIFELGLNIDHFTGKGWNINLSFKPKIPTPLELLLVKNSSYQSYKLKNRLFAERLKIPTCELCGWSMKSEDGRIPVELDHINGDHKDNRLINLRILCPNCHSMQPTHRGRNKVKYKD